MVGSQKVSQNHIFAYRQRIYFYDNMQRKDDTLLIIILVLLFYC